MAIFADPFIDLHYIAEEHSYKLKDWGWSELSGDFNYLCIFNYPNFIGQASLYQLQQPEVYQLWTDYWWNQINWSVPIGGWMAGYYQGNYYDMAIDPIAQPPCPSEYYNVTQELGDGTLFSRQGGTYAYLHYYGSDLPRRVILRVSAMAYSYSSSLGWWYPTQAINPRTICIDSKYADCSDDIPIKMTSYGIISATPSIPNCNWYTFSITPRTARLVTITRSYHPLAANEYAIQLSMLQALYDTASDQMAIDQDGCIPDNGQTMPTDGVPIYVDFKVVDAQQIQFPTNWSGTDFTEERFCENVTDANASLLLGANFAMLKQIKSFQKNVAGQTRLGEDSMVIVANLLTPRIYAHEWVHTQGWDDDYTTEDKLRYGYEIGGWEVNRLERNTLAPLPE